MSWIAARTKPKAERIAEMNLRAQGYEPFLPLVCIDGVLSPLIPGYCFANVEPRQGQWRPIQNTRGISSILMTGERPSTVPARDIHDLMDRADGNNIIHINTKAAEIVLEAGQRVRMTDGPFKGFSAIVERQDANERLSVFLDYMGAQRRVQVGRGELALAL